MLTLQRCVALLITAVGTTCLSVASLDSPHATAATKVNLVRVPEGGIQPQTALAPDGVLHMIYFVGNASGGDIEYVHRDSEHALFSKPIRVNSEPNSAIAIGTVRGPQLAVGRKGTVFVIWFGPAQDLANGEKSMPVFVSRLTDDHSAFEPQRNLVHDATGCDGGISIAADSRGNVFAVWHAAGAEAGEAHRRVYLARSTDDGKTFSREQPVSPPELGACGCCGMRAFVDARNTLYVLYRAAAQSIHRDMTLLVSTDRGETFHSQTLSTWELNACAMTTASLASSGNRIAAAWEKAGEVYFTFPDDRTFSQAVVAGAPRTGSNRKHPAIAVAPSGETLLVWTEGTGWARGGSLAWQLFDAHGKPLDGAGNAPGVPVWGLASAVAERSGSFTVIY